MNAVRFWAVAIIGLIPLQSLVPQELSPSAQDTIHANPQPWTLFRLRPENFLHLPGRGYEYYLPLVPGVVEFNKDFHIRGSRSYENAYVLDGINVTNPVTNTNGFELIPEATEAIDVHTGPVGASHYSANGGLVVSTMRQGGDRLEAFAEYRTDDIVKEGNSVFGTVPLGTNNVVVTVGGPAVEGIRFFLAGQYRHMRNNQAIFLESFRYEGLTDDGFQGREVTRGRLLVAPDSADRGIVDIKENYLPKNWLEQTAINGNVVLDLDQLIDAPLKLQVLGTYGSLTNPGGGRWPEGLTNYFRPEERNYTNATTSWMLAGRLRHDLNATTFYEIGASYQNQFAETYDANYGHDTFEDYLEIPDSAAAAARGFSTHEWRGRYQGPYTQSTIYNFLFTHPDAPNNGYFKNEQTGIGVAIDGTSRSVADWELKVGGRLDMWTLRQYTFSYIRNLLSYLDPNRDGNFSDAPAMDNDYERRVRYLDQGNIVNWGYDYLGNETDGYTLDGSDATLDKPYEPVFASAYAEATYHKNGAVLNFGLRYEFIDAALKTVSGTTVSGQPDFDSIPYDYDLGIMDETVITTTDPFHLFLPRVSLAVGIGSKAQFSASFGQYAQMPPFELLMQSNHQFSQSVSPPDRSPYSFGKFYTPTFPVKPERSTHYEAGASVELLPNLSLGGVLYYKSLKDQLQMARYYNDLGRGIFSVRANDGYGTAKGAEISLQLQRTGGLALQLGYALSSSKGLTSNPLSNVVWVSDAYYGDTVLVERPFDYQQLHRATLLADFRTTSEEGPVLGNITATVVVTFNSGHPFTKEANVQNIGGASPWNVGVRTLIDPRSASYYQDEPTNSSETPSVFNIDFRVSKGFSVGPIHAEFFLAVLNALNTKNVINVYPSTGTATSDGWYEASPLYQSYKAIPLYSSFYKDINIDNRWAYTGATGNDLYSSPRQFQLGLSVRY